MKSPKPRYHAAHASPQENAAPNARAEGIAALAISLMDDVFAAMDVNARADISDVVDYSGIGFLLAASAPNYAFPADISKNLRRIGFELRARAERLPNAGKTAVTRIPIRVVLDFLEFVSACCEFREFVNGEVFKLDGFRKNIAPTKTNVALFGIVYKGTLSQAYALVAANHLFAAVSRLFLCVFDGTKRRPSADVCGVVDKTYANLMSLKASDESLGALRREYEALHYGASGAGTGIAKKARASSALFKSL